MYERIDIYVYIHIAHRKGKETTINKDIQG